MIIEQKHVGEELVSTKTAAGILGIWRSNMAFYCDREGLTPIVVGSASLYIRSEVERVAAVMAAKALQLKNSRAQKEVKRVHKRGMADGDIELKEFEPSSYMTLWRAGVTLGMSQPHLRKNRKVNNIQVYFHNGVRYMLKADLAKLSTFNPDDELF